MDRRMERYWIGPDLIKDVHRNGRMERRGAMLSPVD
jgi:hypothetical protein